MSFNSSSRNVPSCDCPLIRFPLVLPCAGFEEVFFVLIPGRWTVCWSSNPKAQVLLLEGYAIAWGGKTVSFGQVLFVRILNYIFIKKTVWWWGRIWFILWFWLLLSTLSAVCSASLHSGAVRADQNWCHKRQRPPKEADIWGLARTIGAGTSILHTKSLFHQTSQPMPRRLIHQWSTFTIPSRNVEMRALGV